MFKGSEIAKQIDMEYNKRKKYENKLKRNMFKNDENKKIDSFSKK